MSDVVTGNPAFIIFVAFSPLLISFLKQKGWSSQVNALIALVCYILVGLAGAVMSGEALTIENAVPLIAVTTLIGTAAYNLIWSNLGVTGDGAASIEDRLTSATSFIK